MTDSSASPEENRLHPPGIDDIDGHYSLGQELLLFSDGHSTTDGKGGGGVRAVILQGRCLHSAEVAELTAELKREGQSGIVQRITEHLMKMDVESEIAHWAATQSEGETFDQRINSALNIVWS